MVDLISQRGYRVSWLKLITQANYQSINLEVNQNLAEHLTVENSPILFGCRTGICGTCLVIIEGD
ncbi:MAG: 2Fe-2S iron-sulfur cluster-binding protein, partial [Cyanobacteria bacterium J06623_7]